MRRWLLALVIVGAATVALFRAVVAPRISFDTFVETPEVLEDMFNKYDRIVSDQMRVTPRVDVTAPVSVIRWPAWKSKKVAAVPLELRIRSDQWTTRNPVSDPGYIGPAVVRLRLIWPEDDASRAKAPADEESLAVHLSRSHYGDPLYDERGRSGEYVRYATPLTAPREEAIVVSCGGYRSKDPCSVRFEYLGRPAGFSFPERRFGDWQEGYNAARRVLASIAKPIAEK